MASQITSLNQLSDSELNTLISGAQAEKSQILRRLSTPLLQSLSPDPQPGPGKVPSGFRRRDVEDPTAGVERIPGIPETPERAGKMEQIRTANEAFNRVEELIFDPDGSPNWTNIFTGSDLSVDLPLIGEVGFSRGVPKSEGREMSAMYEIAIQAQTRAETGAAMPPEEVENTRKRFQPTILDDESTVRAKTEMFKRGLRGTLKLITVGPTGQPMFDEKTWTEELKRLGGTPPDDLQREAEEAIRQGADPQAVKEELERLRLIEAASDKK